MKAGNLVRPIRQPINAKKNPINLDTLGVVIEVAGMYVKVRWPDGRILIFSNGDLENLE